MGKDKTEETIKEETNKNISKRSALKKLGLKNVLTAAVVYVFFMALISVFVVFLYNSIKSNITVRGELEAQKSAAKLDYFVSESADIVKQMRYSVDNMLSKHVSHKEILDYLVTSTTNIQTTVDDRFTGIYGYIDGEYMDGALWVPEADYVPTERPWYTRAYDAGGKLVLVEPYIDSETGEMTMTAAQLCNDKKSVVALDIKVTMIEEITGEREEGKIGIVTDETGIVIAHSNLEEIGHNYLQEKDTMGAALAKELAAGNEICFGFSYGGTDYLVYDMAVGENWHSISLIDTEKNYKPLRTLIIITIIIFIVTTLVLVSIFINMGRKSIAVETLSDELSEKEIQTEKAIAASEAKTSFLSNMSHEIRTPINAILGMNEMVLRECDEGPIFEYSENIKNAGNTLLGIVNDVLDFSKIEANKLEIIPVEYDLASVLNDLVNMIKTRADAKGLELKIDFDKTIPGVLLGDEIRIKQVVTNILTNAVKYTEMGSVTFSVWGRRNEANPDEVYLDVKISDTGIGIKEEDMDKLFGTFDRIEEERNRNIEGTGLGMTITQKLLKLMNSKLVVESEYGVGSTFSFSVLQGVVSREYVGDYEESFHRHLESKEEYTEKFVAPKAKILVVDDTPINLVVFKGLLSQTRMQIDEANDGFECLEMTKKTKYDIIFLDHMMPKMDGIETFQNMRADEENLNLETPVVCLTANAVSGAREMYMNAGFDDYITKPINTNRLEACICEFLPNDIIKYISEEVTEEEVKEEADSLDPSVFDAIVGIDVAIGLDNCGSPSGYKTVVDMFYKGVKSRAAQIDSFFKDEDWENYTIKVHALKSSARIIGATDLGEDAYNLEMAGKEGRIDFIKENHAKLIAEYEKMYDILDPVCGSGASLGGEAKKEEYEDDLKDEAGEDAIQGWYDRIKEAADEMDIDEIEDIIKEARLYKLPEEVNEKFDKVLDLSTQFEYDEIIDLLD
ncbi:MAG: response regulator [Eubacterium sp.]|nr:response regulator [Eubacterium sp.]